MDYNRTPFAPPECKIIAQKKPWASTGSMDIQWAQQCIITDANIFTSHPRQVRSYIQLTD
jgi:hypothetical protein